MSVSVLIGVGVTGVGGIVEYYEFESDAVGGDEVSVGVDPSILGWILFTGTWRDTGIWSDGAIWNDG